MMPAACAARADVAAAADVARPRPARPVERASASSATGSAWRRGHRTRNRRRHRGDCGRSASAFAAPLMPGGAARVGHGGGGRRSVGRRGPRREGGRVLRAWPITRPPASFATASRSTGAHRRAAVRRRGSRSIRSSARTIGKTGCLEAEVAAVGHRAAARLADQGRRSLARAGCRRRRSRGRSRSTTCSPRRATGDGVSISVMRDTANTSAWPRPISSSSPIPKCSCSAASWPRLPTCCSSRCALELARRLPGPMMQALTIVPAALGADAPAIGAARWPSRRDDRPVGRRSGPA